MYTRMTWSVPRGRSWDAIADYFNSYFDSAYAAQAMESIPIEDLLVPPGQTQSPA